MLISIIIPCYNVQDYIEECIHSAFAQTYTSIEVICIDNNSTDNTWQKLETLKTEFPHLVIDKQLKPGAPAARNKGLTLAKGQWIQFLDADDLLQAKKIEHQVDMIHVKPKISIVAGACLKRNIAGMEVQSSPINQNPFKSLFTTQLGITSSNLWNRQYIEYIGGWDETLKSSQEADLMFRMLQVNEQVIFDSEPLTIVRERPSGQISQGNPEQKWLQYINLRLEIIEWLKKHKPEYYIQHSKFFNSLLFTNIRNLVPYNYHLANQLRLRHIEKHFIPLNPQGKQTLYSFVYRLFGFKLTEKLYKYMRL